MESLAATVIALTDRVEAAIDAGDWLHARELETERRSLLERLAAAPDSAGLAETFSALEERNRRLIGLVEHHKRRVLREAAVARSGHQSAAKYADVRAAPTLRNPSA
jgi:hypothetical protein